MFPASLTASMSLMPPAFLAVPPAFSPVTLSELAGLDLFAPHLNTPIETWKKNAVEPLMKAMTASPGPFHRIKLNASTPLPAPDKTAKPDVVFIVLKGAVEEWQGPLRACTHGEGSVIWANFALGDKPVCTQTVVRSDTELLPVKRENFQAAMASRPWFMARVLQEVSRQSCEYADDEQQYEHAFKRALIGGTAALIPGPFVGEVELFSFLLEEAAPRAFDRFKSELPPRVRWRTVGGVEMAPVLVFARFLNANHQNVQLESSPYDEINLFLPVTVTPDAGNPFDSLHVARMFPDNGLMVALGREISGFPKATAATVMDYLGYPNRGTYRMLTRIGDQVMAEVRFDHPDRWQPFVPPNPGQPMVLRLPNAGAIPLPSTEPVKQILNVIGQAFAGTCTGQALELPTTAWKRIFAPPTQYTATKEEQVEWEPEHFSIDEMVRTPMRFEPMIGEMDVVTLVRKPYFDPTILGNVDVVKLPGTGIRMGTYIRGKLTQLASERVVQYLDPGYANMPRNAPNERARLRWGFPPASP